ncbi:uncharacterized protein A4U43_C06F18240 [Asparagus officinalis]|uniref:Uncharacterized protein n=1 Tax=Asparagus officinalis TaxID=4686 RepID=A0A5P1EMM7_ASPOF|nr:uncharacterized protein A4U43_C06F18240 [Asparagus officinalis]
MLHEDGFGLDEAGNQGRLPVLIAYASRGYIAVAIDSRYHGERASNRTTYLDALVSSWRNGDTMPFIFDMDILCENIFMPCASVQTGTGSVLPLKRVKIWNLESKSIVQDLKPTDAP